MPHEGPTQSDRIAELFSWTFPSVCMLCVCNVLFSDAVLFALRMVGNRVPALLQRSARTINALFNLAFAASGYLWIHGSCRPAVDVCASNALMHVDCAKPVALSLCAIFVFSLVDRLTTLLLYPELSTSFTWRMGETGCVVIGWQLVGEREGLAPLFVALLVARRARFSLPRISKYACGLLRLAVATIAFNALGRNCNTVSQKASVGILLSTVLLRVSWPPNATEERPPDAAPRKRVKPNTPEARKAFRAFKMKGTTTAVPRQSFSRADIRRKQE